MKRYEKLLLDNLQTTDPLDEPLKNVKHAIGSIAYAKGNPLTKTEISIQITMQFSNTLAGVILPAALFPANQTRVPIYLFSLTDFYGGFSKSIIVNPVIPNWVLNLGASGIIGYQALAWLAPAGLIPAVPGDLVLNYFAPAAGGSNDNAWVTIHCNNVAYGTFLNSFVSDLITISILRYIVPIANINQFQNPLFIGYQTLFGKLSVDSIDPRMYITSRDFQQQIADIPINLPIDKNFLMNFQLDVFCQQASFVLFVQKVEPLTHKKL